MQFVEYHYNTISTLGFMHIVTCMEVAMQVLEILKNTGTGSSDNERFRMESASMSWISGVFTFYPCGAGVRY